MSRHHRERTQHCRERNRQAGRQQQKPTGASHWLNEGQVARNVGVFDVKVGQAWQLSDLTWNGRTKEIAAQHHIVWVVQEEQEEETLV